MDFKLNFRQRILGVFGLLMFILGIIVSHIDDVIYSGIAIFVGVIIIDFIFDVFVMKNIMIVENENDINNLIESLKDCNITISR